MCKKILFSPIGGTDPIKYFRDGSMLHICRHYRPDAVYLYLSHEILECHRKDNRYVDSLIKLGELLNHSFEIHIIEKDGLIDVSQYDVFYNDFREEIRKIEAVMEDGDELLLNMSSGAPSMKSALLVMATLGEYKFLPIQVVTPKKKMNTEFEDRAEYDGDLNWELDEDNGERTPNRCVEVKCFNLMRILKIETIKKHINAYDYTAALSVASEIQAELPRNAYRLLQIADARVKLNSSKVNTLVTEQDSAMFPIREGDKQKLFEYALVLQTKIAKQEYADFIRGITPLVVDLLTLILKKECGILLSDCSIVKNEVRQWDLTKLKNNGLLGILDKNYKSRGGFRQGPVYSGQIAALISEKSGNAGLKAKVLEIVGIESRVRNVAAHEIISVTDEWFQKRTNNKRYTAQGIFAEIRDLTRLSGIRADDNAWRAYDSMNERIVEALDMAAE